MTQPAKVQEPSMEEILASIRRIIADDEAKPQEAKPQEAKLSEAKPSETKPAAAEKPASPAGVAKPEKSDAAPPARAPVMKDIPPSAIPAARAAAAKVAPPPVAPAPAAPAATNSQNDIDAMLAGLDETTSESEVRPPLPDGEVFELTDAMALPDLPPSQQEQQRTFHRIEPDDDLEFTENAAAKAMHRQPEPPTVLRAPWLRSTCRQILSRSTVSAR